MSCRDDSVRCTYCANMGPKALDTLKKKKKRVCYPCAGEAELGGSVESLGLILAELLRPRFSERHFLKGKKEGD